VVRKASSTRGVYFKAARGFLKGLNINQAFREYIYFPSTIPHGEGRMDAVIFLRRDEYERGIAKLIKSLSMNRWK